LSPMSPKTHQRGSQPSISRDLTPDKENKALYSVLSKNLEGRPAYECIFKEENLIIRRLAEVKYVCLPIANPLSALLDTFTKKVAANASRKFSKLSEPEFSNC